MKIAHSRRKKGDSLGSFLKTIVMNIVLVLVLALSFTVAFDEDINIPTSNEVETQSKPLTRCEPKMAKSKFTFKFPFKKAKTSLSLKFCDSLYNAIEDGNVKKTRFLLSFSFKRNNAKICYKYYANIEDNPIFTPFTHVCQKGNIELLKLFMSVKKRVNINQSGLGGWTCLHIAIHNGNMELIEYLLSLKGIDVEQKLIESRDTPLNFAVSQGNIDAVAKLLAFGARFDLNIALPAAVHSRSTEMAQFILDYYVQQGGIKDGYYGEDEQLERMKRVAFIINFVAKGSDSNLLIKAALNADEAMTVLLLKYGADVNSVDPVNHNSILHYAAYLRWSYVAEVLLNNGNIKCYFTNMEGQTPYELAREMYFFEIAKMMRIMGCGFLAKNLTSEQVQDVNRIKRFLK